MPATSPSTGGLASCWPRTVRSSSASTGAGLPPSVCARCPGPARWIIGQPFPVRKPLGQWRVAALLPGRLHGGHAQDSKEGIVAVLVDEKL